MATHTALRFSALNGQVPARLQPDIPWRRQAVSWLTQALQLAPSNPAVVISYAAMAIDLAKKAKEPAKQLQCLEQAKSVLERIPHHAKAREMHTAVCTQIKNGEDQTSIVQLPYGVPSILGLKESTIFSGYHIPKPINRTTGDVMGWTTDPETGTRRPPDGFPSNGQNGGGNGGCRP